MRSRLGGWRISAIGCMLLVAASLFGGCGEEPSSTGTATPERAINLPLTFEADGGRTAGRARFIARGAGAALFLGDSGPTFAIGSGDGPRAAVRLGLQNAREGLRPVAGERLPGVVNSYVGA